MKQDTINPVDEVHNLCRPAPGNYSDVYYSNAKLSRQLLILTDKAPTQIFWQSRRDSYQGMWREEVLAAADHEAASGQILPSLRRLGHL